MQKKVVRILSFSNYLAHTDPLFSDSSILKVKDLYFVNIAILMFNYDHGNLPQDLRYLFSLKTQHKYSTRYNSKSKLKIPKRKTKKYGLQSFSVIGAQILNQIKELDFYETSRSFYTFKKN